MNWYVAQSVFESAVEGAGSDYTPLIERSWFLVAAEDENTAEEKAVRLAQDKKVSDSNTEGEQVSWVFICIEQIQEILDEMLGDGTVVWSVIQRAGENDTESETPLSLKRLARLSRRANTSRTSKSRAIRV